MNEETEIKKEEAPLSEADIDAALEAAADAGLEPEPDPKDVRNAQLEEEVAAMKDQLVRALAETENVRKRGERQVQDAGAYAIEKFARDLLAVGDNMSRSLEALNDDDKAELTDKGKSLLEGVELTRKALEDAMKKHGVSPIEAEPGAAFDPNMHNAVTQIPSEHKQGTVASVFQAGWKIKDRVLREAMVAVSAGAPAAEQATESSDAN